MEYRPLGNSEITVSSLCLGTMTFGCQNTEAQAHLLLTTALEHGINFIDTAELYPAPVTADTTTVTETIIGKWLVTQPRDQLVIASKVVGPAPKKWIGHIRGGPQLNAEHIEQALNASLQRLGTDYIDLFQIHWPARNTNYFGKLGYSVGKDKHDNPIIDTVATLAKLVQSGKVRKIGISNETPWGVHQYLNAATQLNVERIVSIQNPYCLLNRTYETGLAEFSHRENIGLLAYSPLAGGALTGKYLDNSPPDARLTLYTNYFYRYTTVMAVKAVREYVQIANKHAITPTAMALAFVRQQPFVASTIIGATTQQQLLENLKSIELTLSDDCLKDIEKSTPAATESLSVNSTALAALIDSHIHFDDDRFDNDRDSVYAAATAQGVRAMVVPATTQQRWHKIQTLSARYKNVFATAGLHPVFCQAHKKDHLDALLPQLEHSVAIGECGLDGRDGQPAADLQRHYFQAQVQVAKEFEKPLIIHAQAAVEEVILILKKAALKRTSGNGVVHSFNGSEQQARRLIDLNFKLSFGGPLTYPRAHKLHRLVRALPLDCLMLETDAPDQPAIEQRNHRNEPQWLPAVLHAVAALKNESPEQLAEACNRNAAELFDLPINWQ